MRVAGEWRKPRGIITTNRNQSRRFEILTVEAHEIGDITIRIYQSTRRHIPEQLNLCLGRFCTPSSHNRHLYTWCDSPYIRFSNTGVSDCVTKCCIIWLVFIYLSEHKDGRCVSSTDLHSIQALHSPRCHHLKKVISRCNIVLTWHNSQTKDLEI